MLIHANTASAQLPPDPGGGGGGLGTVDITINFGCCGTIDIDVAPLDSEPFLASFSAQSSGSYTFQAGETAPTTIKLTPSQGYTVGGLSITQDDFGVCFIISENPSGNAVEYGFEAGASCTLTATFVQDPPPVIEYTVTPSAGAGGSINPSTAVTVEEGSAASFTITADTGYQVIEPVGGTCGGTLSGNTFTTAAVNQNCSVVANFQVVSTEPDADNDGIFDEVDICPETASGEAVDDNGCSATDYIVAEREALHQIFDATGGANWANNDAWSSETSHCNWYGITCNANLRVSVINLRNNNVVGFLPEDLEVFSELEELDLSDSSLRGILPDVFDRLSRLRILKISGSYSLTGNRITGPLPNSLYQATNLETLVIARQKLLGSISTDISNLINLKFLDLQSNELTGSIPETLGSLVNLGYVNLFNNQFTGQIPQELSRLSNLYHFSVPVNKLSGEVPAFFGSLPSLQYLNIGQNDLSGIIPASYGELKNLTYLNLSSLNLEGSLPEELGELSNIRSMLIVGSGIGGEIPPSFSRLSRLQIINLSNNQISGNIPNEILSLPQLYRFMAAGNNISGSLSTPASTIVGLDIFDVSRNELGGVITEALGDALAEIRILRLQGNFFQCPYPSALVDYFAGINESCVATNPSAVSIDRFDYGNGTIMLSVSASDGGSAITSYTATCTDGATSVSDTSSTNRIEVTGLNNGTAYTCRVTATNAVGTSEPSLPTAPITPEELPTGLPIWLLKEAADSAARRSGTL